MPEIILRVAEHEMEKLEKAIAQTRKLQSETRGLREEFSVLRDSFSHHMQLVRGSLALNHKATPCDEKAPIYLVTRQLHPPMLSKSILPFANLNDRLLVPFGVILAHRDGSAPGL
jgi:hypothetical protein